MEYYKRLTKGNNDGTVGIDKSQFNDKIKKDEEKEQKSENATEWASNFIKRLARAGENAMVCCERLAELEDKLEDGTLVDIKTVAKFVQGLMDKDSCPCDYMLFGEEVNEYMIDKCDDWCWCEKNCGKLFITKNYTPCWEMYLKAKLIELQ